MATKKLSVPSHVVAGRKVWRYGQADWERLRDVLDDTCWDQLGILTTTDATKWVTDTVLRAARTCIPLTTLRARKLTHPWLNDLAVALVDAKRVAQGTLLERETTLACSAGLAAEYHDYIVRTAQKMRELTLSSKLWTEEGERSHETRGPGQPHSSSQDQRFCLGTGCAGQSEPLR